MAKRKKSTFERLSSSGLNRKQRRDLGRRLAGNDPGLTIVHSNAGGVDVGNASHFVAVPPDRDANPVQEFGCWTADLKRMAAWLTACRIDTVAIQATGVYSIPLYDILTGHGIRVVLVTGLTRPVAAKLSQFGLPPPTHILWRRFDESLLVTWPSRESISLSTSLIVVDRGGSQANRVDWGRRRLGCGRPGPSVSRLRGATETRFGSVARVQSVTHSS